MTKTDVAALEADIAVQSRHAAEILVRTLEQSRLTVEVAGDARRFLGSLDGILDLCRDPRLRELTASKIRVHGDYHLGQVLWAEDDFYILDFEGEPTRSILERRQKQSPMKDLAGMVRSFGYAAYAGLFAHTATRPSEFERLVTWARTWQTWAGAAFLRSYFSTAGQALFVPADPVQRDALLKAFVVDKALYELNYELNNRPDWVRIPLRGVLELLNGE